MDAQEQRRLLELAAKAANVDFYTPEGMDAPWCGSGFYLRGCAVWNPLTDDGDALRLAVKLHIGVRTHGPDHWLQKNVAVALWDAGEQSGRVTIQVDSDFLRATRRAIVRAAAAIGEKMEAKP